MTIKRVWIEEGCISCSLCMDIAPDVFDVPDGEDCQIRPCAKDHFVKQEVDIVLAAQDCPVEVIQFEADASEAEASDADRPKASPPDSSSPAS